ncbi:UDP-glucuronosyltransferase 2B15, partial [Lamellibrachia satsuma]
MLPWLPQNDLLGHPNTVLFITHCGNNGQYESLYHGVPMIGFPLFSDQHHNAFRMVDHGYGIDMNILTFTANELVNNIHKVLHEKSFKMATQKASDILKSRPMTTQDTAAYWVEHVLKYGGEHLRTGAMDMPLYQFLMLDILLFVLVFAPEVNSWLELVQRSTVLYIVTRDSLFEWPEPHMPNVIHTPGVTTHPAGVLPQQMKELMDAATDGAIILSFGSLTGQLPAEIINKFLVAFEQLRQTVIFKFGGRNSKTPSNVPKNVHLLPWLPQNNLLGHPNTVLFITHCGNNGQYESLYHGVPMIGFPLFAEQHHNAFRMVDHGYGIDMNILTFTADEL